MQNLFLTYNKEIAPQRNDSACALNHTETRHRRPSIYIFYKLHQEVSVNPTLGPPLSRSHYCYCCSPLLTAAPQTRGGRRRKKKREISANEILKETVGLETKAIVAKFGLKHDKVLGAVIHEFLNCGWGIEFQGLFESIFREKLILA